MAATLPRPRSPTHSSIGGLPPVRPPGSTTKSRASKPAADERDAVGGLPVSAAGIASSRSGGLFGHASDEPLGGLRSDPSAGGQQGPGHLGELPADIRGCDGEQVKCHCGACGVPRGHSYLLSLLVRGRCPAPA